MKNVDYAHRGDRTVYTKTKSFMTELLKRLAKEWQVIAGR